MRNLDKIALFVLLSVGCGSALAMGCSTFGDATPADADAGQDSASPDVSIIYPPEAGDDAGPVDAGPPVPKYYEVTTLAGTGEPGCYNDLVAAATFSTPVGIALGPDGSLYVARGCNMIRKIANGMVSTYAGTGDMSGANGDCSSASFSDPYDIVLDKDNIMYVADEDNSLIRKITPLPCTVSTLAGGDANSTFHYPRRLTLGASGNLYVADGNNTIRKVTPAGNVTTIQGATFIGLGGIVQDKTADTDILYVTENNNIRKITFDKLGNPTVSTLSTLAGSPGSACALTDGTGAEAAFCNPDGLAIDASGNLYVADGGNNAIRKVTPDGVVTTIAGKTRAQGATEGSGDQATFNAPKAVAVDDNNGVVYVVDTNNHKIRQLTPVY